MHVEGEVEEELQVFESQMKICFEEVQKIPTIKRNIAMNPGVSQLLKAFIKGQNKHNVMVQGILFRQGGKNQLIKGWEEK